MLTLVDYPVISHLSRFYLVFSPLTVLFVFGYLFDVH